MSGPDLELRLPSGLSPRTRLRTLAESGEQIALLAGPASRSLVFDAVGRRFRLSAHTSRESGLVLAFSPAPGDDEVRAAFTAGLDLSARLRTPPRRAKGLGPALAAVTEGRTVLRLELLLPAGATLAAALRQVARWAVPAAWARARRLPRGDGWQLDARRGIELGGELRVGRLLALAPGATLPTPVRVSGDLRFEADASWVLRSRLRLRRAPDATLLLEAERRQDDERAWLWQLSANIRPLAGAGDLARALVDALPEDLGRFLEQGREILATIDDLQRRLDALPREVRDIGRVAAGPGSRLKTLIDRLRRLEGRLDDLADSRSVRRARSRLRTLREAAEKLQARLLDEADQWALRLGARIDRLSLGSLRRRLSRWIARIEELAGEMAARAGAALAEGFAAEFESLHRRRRRGERLIEARVRPGTAVASALLEDLLSGDWRAAALARGERGLLTLRGDWIREQQRLRRRSVRLRLFGAEAFASREWLSQARIRLGLDGALEVGRRERFVRSRSALIGGDLARLVIDLGVVQREDRAESELRLSWERGWRSPRSRRRALRELRELLAVLGPALAESGGTGEAAVPPSGELQVSLRLDRRAVRSLLAREKSASVWERKAFWPAWNLARGLTAPKDAALRLADGRVATASSSVRRALARSPEGRTLEPFLPRASAARRETLAAEFRTARALLRALATLRRLPENASAAQLARAARRVLAAFGHVQRVDRTPLLVLALLVPGDERRLDLRLSPSG